MLKNYLIETQGLKHILEEIRVFFLKAWMDYSVSRSTMAQSFFGEQGVTSCGKHFSNFSLDVASRILKE